MHKIRFPMSLVLLALCGCGANGVTTQAFGGEQDISATDGSSPSSKNGSSTSPCSEKGENNMCLGLKYVAYKNSRGTPVVTEEQANENLVGINKIWSQCNINFRIDSYLAADPNEYSLTYNTANSWELNQIRKTFDDQSHILVVTTGKWDRSGSLGNTGANAWTNMPGESIMGAILESSVGTFANIIAHELGHYLNLDHQNDTNDLMNPIIYDSSSSLSSSQCEHARNAVQTYWQQMLR